MGRVLGFLVGGVLFFSICCTSLANSTGNVVAAPSYGSTGNGYATTYYVPSYGSTGSYSTSYGSAGGSYQTSYGSVGTYHRHRLWGRWRARRASYGSTGTYGSWGK